MRARQLPLAQREGSLHPLLVEGLAADFHQFQESRDRGLILIDAGHYATERPACDRLVSKLRALEVDWVQLSQKDEDFRQFYQENELK